MQHKVKYIKEKYALKYKYNLIIKTKWNLVSQCDIEDKLTASD